MKIVFCLPGSSYQSGFFDSWMKLIATFDDHEYSYIRSEGSNVSLVRERCLHPFRNVLPKSKDPFYGEIDYDYIMWIDSDMIFKPEDFWKLIKNDVDIVSGCAKMNPNSYALEVYQDRLPVNGLIEVKWVGMAFMLVKKGVFEKVESPWFQTKVVDGKLVTEDIYFCKKAQEAGYKIWIDPTVNIGHIKPQVLI
jgi:hypothetical protein